MPETQVLFYAEPDGSSPLVEWLATQPAKIRDKCVMRIERLEALGHELRRPEADLLRNGIYELRVRYGHVNLRMLYFFHMGRAVVTHGVSKEEVLPSREIDLAIRRRTAYAANPVAHTYRRK